MRRVRRCEAFWLLWLRHTARRCMILTNLQYINNQDEGAADPNYRIIANV